MSYSAPIPQKKSEEMCHQCSERVQPIDDVILYMVCLFQGCQKVAIREKSEGFVSRNQGNSFNSRFE